MRATVAIFLLAATLSPTIRSVVAIEVDWPMFLDPPFVAETETDVFSPNLKPLWLEALAGPEVDLRRLAADTIALAHSQGMPDLADTAGALADAMEAPSQHPSVRLAAARALVTIDAEQFASRLFQQSQRGVPDIERVVEPALARWGYQPIHAVWLERLRTPHASPRRLMLAIRCVATAEIHEAQPELRRLVLDREIASSLRLEAARSLAGLCGEGLEDDARRLTVHASQAWLVDRLVGATMLREHQGETAESLLLRLAEDTSPAVAAVAWKRLLEIDPNLVVPLAEQTIVRDDANLRRLAAEALIARPSPERITVLAERLNDAHPEVRAYVREAMILLADNQELDAVVRDEGLRMLATDQWRAQEQAALLLAALDEKRAADRLVDLLEVERPEVFITVAWALGRLAVPETLEAIFNKTQRRTAEFERGEIRSEEQWRHVVPQTAQLIQALGIMRYTQADAFLRRYIPKMAPFGGEARAAAIWTLGHFHADEADPELAQLLESRLADALGLDPEDEDVRRMSAASLGRMKATSSLGTLRRFARLDGVTTSVGYTCGWAIHQLTGEEIPVAGNRERLRGGWFLEPLAE